jgi:hypothetical protein
VREQLTAGPWTTGTGRRRLRAVATLKAHQAQRNATIGISGCRLDQSHPRHKNIRAAS